MSDYAGFQDGYPLVSELASELAQLVKAHGQIAEHHWRRILLRSLFALLEAFISRSKGRALEVASYGRVDYPPKLLRILQEGREVVGDDGVARWETFRPRTTENLKASLRAYSESLGTSTPLGGEAPLPQEFQLALQARNRVTHPKTLKDLAVGDIELAAAIQILKWLQEVSCWSKDHELRNIRELRDQMQSGIDEFRKRLQSRPDPEGGRD